jgi:hypothetical protein
MPANELQSAVAEYAEHVFTHLNMIGLAKRQANPRAIQAAVALFKSLKLIKQTNSGTRNAHVVQMNVTPLGHEILGEEPAVANIRIGLVSLLVKSSPTLTTLLRSLAEIGPLSRPVANPLPGTPTKGATFNRTLLEGMAEYQSQEWAVTEVTVRTTTKQPASMTLKAMAAQATQRHPASVIPSFDKVITLAADLGLLWRDVKQINQAFGVESIGSAASEDDGVLIPNIPDWQVSAETFQEVLWNVYLQQVNSSGLTTIRTLRGGIGRELCISDAVVDAFLCLTHEAGDRGDCPFTLQFEPNDDLLYAASRRPLICQETAFDFIEVHRSPESLPINGSPSTYKQIGLPPSF